LVLPHGKVNIGWSLKPIAGIYRYSEYKIQEERKMTGVFSIEANENAGSAQVQIVTGVHVTTGSTCVGMTALERVRFFPRQLISADDLTLEQSYFRNKLRRHNRLLHGWGIVCGALVSMSDSTTAAEAIIGPGCILGPYGDEIVIDRSLTLDLAGYITNDCADEPCNDAGQDDGQASSLYYIAVKHAECMSEPVHVLTGVCGCDELQCEYSRIRDHYEIGLLTQLPSTYDPMPEPVTDYCGKTCPACPNDPWVILAAVSHVVRIGFKIDPTETRRLRRYVRSHAEDYYTCEEQSDTTHRLSNQAIG
jgi:hypothetical protein